MSSLAFLVHPHTVPVPGAGGHLCDVVWPLSPPLSQEHSTELAGPLLQALPCPRAADDNWPPRSDCWPHKLVPKDHMCPWRWTWAAEQRQGAQLVASKIAAFSFCFLQILQNSVTPETQPWASGALEQVLTRAGCMLLAFWGTAVWGANSMGTDHEHRRQFRMRAAPLLRETRPWKQPVLTSRECRADVASCTHTNMSPEACDIGVMWGCRNLGLRPTG